MASPDTAMAPTRSSRRLPLSVPVLQGNEWKYLKECLDTGWVSSVGPFVDRFEREVAKYVGVTDAVATASGTAALHVALRIMGVREDDEVLVPTLTFIAPVNAIRYCGAHPVFVDADPETWQMDVRQVERFLAERCSVERVPHGTGYEYRNLRTKRRVRAILPVHILGLACDMQRIIEVAHNGKAHLWVVEDAAEGMGVRYRGRHVGWWGDVGVLSFNGNKIITCGGGGMVVMSNNPARAKYARYLTPDPAKYARYLTTQAKDDGQEYIHREVGYNYRLTNLQAALGVAQLEQLEGFLARKRAIAQAYAEALGGVGGLSLMPTSPHTDATYWLYTILLASGTTVPERQAILARLQVEGVEARPLWHPIHGLPPYRECEAVDIACAPDLYARAISLPSSVNLTEDDVRFCCEAVRKALG